MRYPKAHSSIAGGAGYLSPLASSLLEILDRVLVDGYTQGEVAVPSLGWSRPFDRYLNAEVYRPGAGLQLLFKIDDNQVVSGFRVSAVTGYESMSDIETGFGGWGASFFGKASGLDPLVPTKYSPAWWIIGDSKGFYLLVGDHESNPVDASRGVPVVIHYLGDFDSLEVGDVYNSLILAHSNNILLPSVAAESFFKRWGAFGYTSNGTAYAASTGGSLGVAVGLAAPEGGRDIGAVVGPVSLDPVHMVVGDPIPRLTPLLISAGTSPRGKLPGLYSLWPQVAGKTGDTFLNAAGDSFLLINVAITADNWEQYAIQLNAW